MVQSGVRLLPHLVKYTTSGMDQEDFLFTTLANTSAITDSTLILLYFFVYNWFSGRLHSSILWPFHKMLKQYSFFNVSNAPATTVECNVNGLSIENMSAS